MKLRAIMACAAAAATCLGLASAASAATQTKTAAGPGLNIVSGQIATTTFVSKGLPGKLIDVNVAINGITHTWPEDIEATLTGPNGATVMLMSDVADGTDAVGVNLLFDDSATAKLPFANGAVTGFPLIGGTYQPTNHAGLPPELEPLASTVPNLAGLFAGGANGTWVLKVTDDFQPLDETGNKYGESVLSITTSFKCKKKKKGKKGAVAAKKKCGKKKKNKMVLSVR